MTECSATMSSQASSDGTPTHVGPVARQALRAIAGLPENDKKCAIEMIDSAITNRSEEMGATAYCHEDASAEYRFEAKFADGVPALCGQVSLKDRCSYVGEMLISVIGLPESKMEASLAKANSGNLMVKEIVSFLPEDCRMITGGYIDPDRSKLWLQIEYHTHEDVRQWPTWSEIKDQHGWN